MVMAGRISWRRSRAGDGDHPSLMRREIRMGPGRSWGTTAEEADYAEQAVVQRLRRWRSAPGGMENEGYEERCSVIARVGIALG